MDFLCSTQSVQMLKRSNSQNVKCSCLLSATGYDYYFDQDIHLLTWKGCTTATMFPHRITWRLLWLLSYSALLCMKCFGHLWGLWWSPACVTVILVVTDWKVWESLGYVTCSSSKSSDSHALSCSADRMTIKWLANFVKWSRALLNVL